MANFIDIVIRAKNEFSSTLNTLTSDLASAQRTLKSTGKAIEQTGYNTMKVGEGMIKGITLPIVGIGVAAVKTAGDFEAAMSQVQAISGATGDEMEKLSRYARDMGASTVFSASESAEAMTYLGQAGWDVQQMLDGLPGLLNLAASSNTDLATTASIVTNTISGLNMEASESARVADVMAAAASGADTNVEMMGETFKYVAPVAGALGYAIEDVALVTGLMANAGVKGSQAGTSMKTAFTRLAAPTKEVAKGLDMINLSAEDFKGLELYEQVEMLRKGFSGLDETQQVQAASAIFGKEAMAGMLGVINASDEDFKKLQDSIEGSAGLAQKMADIMTDNLKGSIEETGGAMEEAAITIGNILIPVLRDLIDGVGDLFNKFNSLDPAQQELIVKTLLKLATIGPILWGVGRATKFVGDGFILLSGVAKSLKGVSSIGGAFSAILGPGGKIVLILLAIVAAAYLLIKNWDKIKAKAEEIFPGIGAKVAWFRDLAVQAFQWVAEKFGPILGKLGELGEMLFTVFVFIAGMVINQFLTNFQAFVEKWGWLFEIAANTIITIIDTLLSVFTGIIEFLTGVFTGNWELAWKGVVRIFGSIFGGIATIAQDVVNTVIGLVNDMISAINSISIPDWVPGFGGASPNIGTIGTVTFADDFNAGLDSYVNSIGQNYKGTVSWKGGPTWVHERGGEIIDLPQGTRIYPHDQSVQMARAEGQAGGKNVVINIAKLAETIEVKDKNDIEAIAKAVATKIVKELKNTSPEPKYV